MSQRNWHGDTTKQQMLRACESRVAADILNIMIGAAKKKAPPNIPMDAPERFYQVSAARLSVMIGCCKKTIDRGLRRLVERGFITIHYDHTFDRRNRYQVHPEKISQWLQRMPLFEVLDESDDVPLGQNVPLERDKMSQCIGTKCPNGEGQNVPINNTSLSSSDSIIIISDGGDPIEIDAEKEKLIDDCRSLGVSKELTEHLLTVQSRKTLRNGIMYVQKRCSREKVDNPGGLFNRFCQRPWEHGHERDAHGVWMPSASIALAKKMMQRVAKTSEHEEVCRLPFSRPWLVDNTSTNK